MTGPLTLEAVRFVRSGRALLDDVSFSLERGPVTVVLGANGAGKSLLLRIAHGLLRPTSGRVTAVGAQAFVFQRPVMLRRSALQNVEYPLAVRGVERRERRRLAATTLERVGLAGAAAQSARTLSVGEQQRLALARAWALDPELLFLDEPTASLDPTATTAIEEILRSIHAGGAKIVLVTHDLGQARRLGGDVLFLDRGRLVVASTTSTENS
ncbi:MAG: ATP-binding cassette domain-containing protein, partial [Planctomycetota bacterium JB042]